MFIRKNLYWLLMVVLVLSCIRSGCGGSGGGDVSINGNNGTTQSRDVTPETPETPDTPTTPETPTSPDNPTVPDNPASPDNPATPETPTTTAIPFTTLTGTWQASNGTGTITSGDRQGTMSLSTTHSNTITFTNANGIGSLDGTSQIYFDMYDDNGTFAAEYEDEFGGGSMNFTGITFENTSGNTWVMERLNKYDKTTRTTITFTSSTTAEVERLEERNMTFSFKYTITKQ